MQPGEIRDHLIERLRPIFGAPKSADGLAETLAKHVPTSATADALTGLADRIIATRKTKGFPSASELIDEVKALRPTAAATARTADPNELRFDGPIPMVWVDADDPRWGTFCDMVRAADPQRKPFADTSKWASGRMGAFFRAEMVDAVLLTDVERETMRRAERDAGAVVGRVAAGMSMFKASMRQRPGAEPLPAPVAPGQGPAVDALRQAFADAAPAPGEARATS